MSSPPKIPFYGRRYAARTTTGCLTCRRRRLKCDESKPACTRCNDGALEFTYAAQLRWPTKGAKYGNNRASLRRAGKNLEREPQLKPQQPTTCDLSSRVFSGHTEVSIVENPSSSPRSYLDYAWDAHSPASPIMVHSPSSSTMTLTAKSLGYTLPKMDTRDKMLFDFYASKMCPRCMVRNGGSKTYRQVVLPLIFESNLLLKTVLAVAANRLKILDERFQTVALSYQNMSLQGLRQLITSAKLTWFSRLETLSIVLMLCFFDLYSPGPASIAPHGFVMRAWRAHSLGVRQLLEDGLSHVSQDPHYEQAILSFLGQYFASRSVLTYATMSNSEQPVDIFEDAAYWLAVVDRPSTEINPFAGCSNQRLRITLDIMHELRQCQSLLAVSTKYDKNQMDSIREEILRIQQFPPQDACRQVMRNDNINPSSSASVKLTAEAFRFAVLILLENLSEVHSQSRKAHYVSQIFGLLESGVKIPPRGKLGSSSYLWPYFIAGCHLTCPQQQAAMLSHLVTITRGNVDNKWYTNFMDEQLRGVLMSVWSQSRNSDLEKPLIVDDQTWNKRFVWERVIWRNNLIFEWV